MGRFYADPPQAPDLKGVPPALAAQIQADHDAKTPEQVCYYPNVPAWELFCAAGTQWRRGGMAGARTGLDYAAVEALMRIRGVKKRKRLTLLDEVRVIESAALNRWAELSKDG